MQPPYFSIIIPTLNEVNYIGFLLTSLSEQTNTSFEVFVADGTSTDGTKDAITAFKSNYPLTLVSCLEKNVGLQRNTAAKQAKGTYLVFCDADITLPQNYLADMQNLLMHHAYDFVTTRCIPDTHTMPDRFLAFFVYCIQRTFLFFGTPFFSGQNLLMRRNVFETIGGFDPTVIHAEDHELVQRSAKNGYTGMIVYNPIHCMSFRRLKREGTLSVAWRYFLSGLHILFKGPIRTPIFEYKMGGKVE